MDALTPRRVPVDGISEHPALPVHGESVVLTGIGVALPNTTTVGEFWQNVSQGRSQIGEQTRFERGDGGLPVYAAAQINDFDHRPYLPRLAEAHARKYSREILITMSAVARAREDARLAEDDIDPRRLSG